MGYDMKGSFTLVHLCTSPPLSCPNQENVLILLMKEYWEDDSVKKINELPTTGAIIINGSVASPDFPDLCIIFAIITPLFSAHCDTINGVVRGQH